MQLYTRILLLTGLFVLPALAAIADESGPKEDEPLVLEYIKVTGQRVANMQPASTYASMVTELRFDPQVDVQARGLPEGQADVSVRGGLFENTGFKIGAVSIFDPQTGHYAAELPIDPDMLATPILMTDTENALYAFNASMATLSYGYADIVGGGSLRAGFGTDALRFASARLSHKRDLTAGRSAGVSLAAAISSGDGTLPNGDHDFKRFAGHYQFHDGNAESNIILGYQDKFFGWPGAYTGFVSLPETDHLKQGLLIMDHRRSSDRGWWQIAAAYRWLDDDYDFDRRTPDAGGPGSFEHETRSFSLGVNGSRKAGKTDWDYNLVFAADRLVRSTDLTNGYFNSRSYLSVRVLPSWYWSLASGAELRIRAGLSADMSNRDKDALMPLGGIRWLKATTDGDQSIGLDLSRTSQLPGYTALNSRPTGLFGGNPDLGREFASTLTLSYQLNRGPWHTRAAVFVRKDDDLVDWTFRQDAPFARQANAVDIDVSGFELSLQFEGDQWQALAAYTFLDKDADYGESLVDASYYALNFARHRATFALSYQPVSWLDLRLDNEYRQQEKNILRTGDDKAWLASFSIGWRLPTDSNLRLDLVADNLTDSEFEEYPGTPAYGRQFSLALGLDWY